MPPASDLSLTSTKNATPTTDDYNPENKARELLDTRIGDVCEKAEDTCNIDLYFNLILKMLVSTC